MKIIFKLIELLEYILAYLQGKGYGTSTIQTEVKFALKKVDNIPHLAIDIGANKGEYTAELRRKKPNLEIHSFEPSKTNIEKLMSRFNKDDNIFIVPSALSNVESTSILFADHSGSGLASLSKRKLSHVKIDFDFEETIQTMRFEDYWESYLGKRYIDIVKIDVEGHELNVLEGFGKALQQTKVIQFEFGGCNIDTRTFFQDFWYFFTDNKFEIFRITPFGLKRITKYQEKEEYFSTTNFICVNKYL